MSSVIRREPIGSVHRKHKAPSRYTDTVRVQNIREVSEAIGDIIRKLEGAPAVAPRKIRGLVLSVGGRSIAAVPTTAALRFPRECEITESHVQRLIYEATHDYVGDHCIVDTLPKIFFVNNTSVKKAVGGGRRIRQSLRLL